MGRGPFPRDNCNKASLLFPTEDRTDKELQWEPLSEEETKLLDQVSDPSLSSSSGSVSESPSGSRRLWTPPRTPPESPAALGAAQPRTAFGRLVDFWTWPRPSSSQEPDEALMF